MLCLFNDTGITLQDGNVISYPGCVSGKDFFLFSSSLSSKLFDEFLRL
jgi:hypothetical protein